MDYIKTNQFFCMYENREVDSTCLSLFVQSICINLEGTFRLNANIPQKALNVSNTMYLVLKIILYSLILFSTSKTERKIFYFPKCELPAILFGAQGLLGWWCVIVASFFRDRIWGFPQVLPSKLPHCITYECSDQAKTKRDPKLRFFSFPKDNS